VSWEDFHCKVKNGKGSSLVQFGFQNLRSLVVCVLLILHPLFYMFASTVGKLHALPVGRAYRWWSHSSGRDRQLDVLGRFRCRGQVLVTVSHNKSVIIAQQLERPLLMSEEVARAAAVAKALRRGLSCSHRRTALGNR
jgi:hypothetical protein